MKKLLVGLVVASVVGVGSLAFAHGGGHGGYGGHRMGPGYGGHMMGPGYGSHMMGPGHGGYGWNVPPANPLSPEQTKKLEQVRQNYWEETGALRQELFSKQQELRNLYAQPNPDQKAIGKLQKETFDLKQRLREKNFAFQQEANQIAPQFQGRHGSGWGRHHWGSRWGGSCQNF